LRAWPTATSFLDPPRATTEPKCPRCGEIQKIARVQPEMCNLFDMTWPLSVISEFGRPMLGNSLSAHHHRQCSRGKNERDRLAEAIPALRYRCDGSKPLKPVLLPARLRVNELKERNKESGLTFVDEVCLGVNTCASIPQQRVTGDQASACLPGTHY
jgi:hypothetical protein